MIGFFRARTRCHAVDSVTLSHCPCSASQERSATRFFLTPNCAPTPTIKRPAVVQNPEFDKKQRMRLSPAMTPRVITCAEDLPQFVALPRGCQDELEALLRAHGVSLEVEDQRVGGQRLQLQFQGTLTSL